MLTIYLSIYLGNLFHDLIHLHGPGRGGTDQSPSCEPQNSKTKTSDNCCTRLSHQTREKH